MTGEKPPLPVGLKVAGSIFVLLHFFIIGVHVLAARSGPWPSPFGASTAEPPEFARRLSGPGFDYYLNPLHMPSRYHFASNGVAYSEVKFELKLYDKANKLVKTLHFPEEGGNPWVRHRLRQMTHFLADDSEILPQRESALPKGQAPVMVPVWVPEKGISRLQQKPLHEIRQPYWSPSQQSVLAAEAYVRYQCRVHDAASGELIRRSRAAVQPSLLMMNLNEVPAETFQELVASFGKMHR